MKIKLLLFGAIIMAIAGCTNSSTEEKTGMQDTVVKTAIKNVIGEDELAAKKDLVCGMPAYKYLEDTTLYKGKIYGFCGKGCKDEFLANPDSLITAGK